MSHITKEQRYAIEVLLSRGESKACIAKTIGRSKSVVSREIGRNCDKRSGQYRADLAQRKYEQRKESIPKREQFTASFQATVDRLLQEDFSPEQIAGRCKVKGVECVSHEPVYLYVWADKRGGGTLHTHLRRKGRRYRKRGAKKDSRGIIVGRVDIDQRPQEVEERKRFGDLEIDTIIGQNHQGAIVTTNDRASGFLRTKRVEKRTSDEVYRATVKPLKDEKEFLKTITGDNGKGFADHRRMALTLQISVYFAKPYPSWERGANENLNGLIRQYIPKSTDFKNLDDGYIKWVAERIKSRPRKRFNYKIPIFVTEKLLTMAKVALVA